MTMVDWYLSGLNKIVASMKWQIFKSIHDFQTPTRERAIGSWIVWQESVEQTVDWLSHFATASEESTAHYTTRQPNVNSIDH
jgi:hypothetical protein